jgi:FAD dependent oxidoreductase
MTEPTSTHQGRQFHQSEMFQVETFDGRRRVRAERKPGRASITEPAREIPVHAECDVLVLGGGPAGMAAAVAAGRLGARTMLMERYNHLGGLATGGLVLWIDRMTDWEGKLVIRGFAEEFIDRLPKGAVAGPPRKAWGSKDAATAAWWQLRTAAYHGTVTWSPTCDPEWMKLTAQEMVLEAGAELMFHCWGAMPVVEDNAVRGVVFESKAGRRAVLAKVVVDATGDGDLFARAGARHHSDINADDIHHCSNTAWLFAGCDMPAFLKFRSEEPEAFSAFMQAGKKQFGLFERAFVSWRDDVALFMGPRMVGFNALDPDDQTEVEIRSHRLMMQHLEFYKAHAPGFAGAYPILSAPQLGVRHTRRLAGASAVLRESWDGRVMPDEIAVTPSPGPRFPNISIPYGALVPVTLDGLLAPGRHVSCDPTSHSFMREIPQCWLTGHAAGAAAALAVQQGVEPRAVNVRAVQKALLAQGAWLTEAEAIRAAA